MTVKVGGGAYLEEVDKVLEPHNLGVTVGTYPETGMALLGTGRAERGRYGILAKGVRAFRPHVWTCCHLMSAQLFRPARSAYINR